MSAARKIVPLADTHDLGEQLSYWLPTWDLGELLTELRTADTDTLRWAFAYEWASPSKSTYTVHDAITEQGMSRSCLVMALVTLWARR